MRPQLDRRRASRNDRRRLQHGLHDHRIRHHHRSNRHSQNLIRRGKQRRTIQLPYRSHGFNHGLWVARYPA